MGSHLFNFQNKLEFFKKINNLLLEISKKNVDYNNSRAVNEPRISDVAKYIKKDIPDLLRQIINDDSYVIKGSIGAGIVTKTPWIAIMDKSITKTTQQGVYLVILFSQDLKTPYLSLCMGTTEPGKFGFRLNPKDVKNKADNYRQIIHTDNTIFKTTTPDIADKGYKAAVIFNTAWDYNITEDKPSLLANYLNLYFNNKALFPSINTENLATNNEEKKMADIVSETNISEEIDLFKEYLKSKGLVFNDKFIERFVLSLKSKPFVILSGLTGSGKTQLALIYAKWKKEQKVGEYLIVPVGADWTNREYILGYPNALQPGVYVKPNGVLDLLIQANKPENKNISYFLILDEMNMSYVERYFADFLSSMESGEPIPLWEDKPEDSKSDVPKQFSLPKNFYIIGTINVDETTYMFSPKVLDRAFVLEFHIEKTDMETYLNIVAPDFSGALLKLFEQLAKINAEFGYRTAKEMAEYMKNAKEFGTEDNDILDAVIMQKLLPKVHGSRKKISPTLIELWKICFNDDNANIDSLKDFPSEETAKPLYPISAKKIWRMYQILQDNGFVSFAEA